MQLWRMNDTITKVQQIAGGTAEGKFARGQHQQGKQHSGKRGAEAKQKRRA
jgi:hypothetical protein